MLACVTVVERLRSLRLTAEDAHPRREERSSVCFARGLTDTLNDSIAAVCCVRCHTVLRAAGTGAVEQAARRGPPEQPAVWATRGGRPGTDPCCRHAKGGVSACCWGSACWLGLLPHRADKTRRSHAHDSFQHLNQLSGGRSCMSALLCRVAVIADTQIAHLSACMTYLTRPTPAVPRLVWLAAVHTAQVWAVVH